jgi:hypothetical protein
VDRLLGEGFSASKVRNVLMPVRAIYRMQSSERDHHQPDVQPSPATETGRRDRIASAAEAAALIAGASELDRALWQQLFMQDSSGRTSGAPLARCRPRRGCDTVERSWDSKAGFIEPKSRKSTRRVPISGSLRDYLKCAQDHDSARCDGFVFGTRPDRPFTPSHIRKRAARAWDAANSEGITR